MSEQIKLPAIFHGTNDQEGRLFTRLRDSDNGTYLYMVQNGDVTMYEVFNVKMIDWFKENIHQYPECAAFGKTAFGVADPNEAERLFEKLSFEPNNVIVI